MCMRTGDSACAISGTAFTSAAKGLKLRLIFEVSSAPSQPPRFEGTAPSKLLYFHMLGDHDEVRRFLKRHR